MNPKPSAIAPITTAGSTGDAGVADGQGVGIIIVDFLSGVVAVVIGVGGVVSGTISLGAGVRRARNSIRSLLSMLTVTVPR